MKKLIMLIMLPIVVILLSGCSTISNNVKDKTINTGFSVCGVKGTAFDPATGSLSPTGWLGWFDGYYHSCPVQKGQSYKVTRTVKSWWTGEFSSEIIIEIEEAPTDGYLQVRKDPYQTPKAEFIPEK